MAGQLSAPYPAQSAVHRHDGAGQNRTKSYKLHVSEAVPEEDWITVEQTHEAIIPGELFDKAQALFERDTRTAPTRKQVYLFSGFLRCADCGKAMNRKLISQPHRDYYYYICSTFKKSSTAAPARSIPSAATVWSRPCSKRSAARLRWRSRWMS